MILLNELSNFIKAINELISYENIRKLTEPDISYLNNQLLDAILDYRKYNSSYELKLCEAKINYELHNYTIAEKLYQEIISEQRDLEEAYSALGKIYLDNNRFSESIEVLNIAVTLEPNNFLNYARLGDVYTKINNLDKAIKNYEKVIELAPELGWRIYDLALIYTKMEKYDIAIAYCERILQLDKENNVFLHERVKETLNEIRKREANSDYEKISQITEGVKELLHAENYIVTHYTSLSTTCALIQKKSKLRLSEATFLNDTSEGTALLNYLGISVYKGASSGLSYEFIKKPYIGSFVNEKLDNDLTLWRMYGKENNEEAGGCSLKIDGTKYINKFRERFKNELENWDDDIAREFKFYRVAYLGNNFCKSGNSKNDKLLKEKLSELKNVVKEIELTTNILQSISEIAYLFKSKEYQYENETRLVLANSIINEVLDDSFIPTKVYVELDTINSSLIKLVIGPKVDLAEEWAASFYYSLKKENLFPQIEISTLPFK